MEEINLNQHAYVIEGERDSSIEILKQTLENKWGIKLRGNPDLRESFFETLPIDEARIIRTQAITKPLGDKNIFIIATNFIGHEAQNALLKLLEEPISDTYFFIIIPNANSLLSTVRSRARIISLTESKEEAISDPKKFLKSTPEERLKILSSFLSHDSESKKSDLLSFLNKVEKEMTSVKNRTLETNEALSELINLKKYLFDRSPSVKIIGEYLALRLPVTSNK